MIEEIRINQRIRHRIQSSDLERPIKQLLLNILQIEFREGRLHSQYSKSYQSEINKAYILLKRGTK